VWSQAGLSQTGGMMDGESGGNYESATARIGCSKGGS